MEIFRKTDCHQKLQTADALRGHNIILNISFIIVLILIHRCIKARKKAFWMPYPTATGGLTGTAGPISLSSTIFFSRRDFSAANTTVWLASDSWALATTPESSRL